MFTVILLSDRARARFDRWSVLFEPFEADHSLAICDWNRRSPGDTLAQAVPQLSEAILGKSEWRAVVLDMALDEPDAFSGADPENPFDYLENMGVDPISGRPREQLNLTRSPHALIRLAHMLLGYPDMGTKAFVADPSHWDPEVGRRVHQSEVEAPFEAGSQARADAVARFRSELVSKRDVQLHFREVEYSEDERTLHRQLSDRYRSLHSRPTEVIFMATRAPVEMNPVEVLKKAWRPFTDQGPSRFVERNDYPASCRFVVHDLPPQTDTRFELDELRMWLALLCIAANDLPASALQAERVYRVGTEVDSDALAHALIAHLGELAATREKIEARIQQSRHSTSDPIGEILRQRPVHVSFDQLGGEELHVSTTGFGWASDMPRRESVRWQDAMSDLRLRTDAFVRRPRRVLARTVAETRHQTHSFLDEDIAVNGIARDELQEELVKRTRRLAQPATAEILNRARLRRILDENDKAIRQAIAQRMTRNTILAASGVVLMAWLIGFSPYLIQAGFLSGEHLADSAAVLLIIVLLLILGGVITLIVMKRRLVNRMRECNRQLRNFVGGVNTGAHEFGAYLSDVITYMRGQAVLISTQMSDERHAGDRARWAMTRNELVERMEREKAIVLSLDHQLAIDRGSRSPLEANSDPGPQVRQLFRLATGRGRAMLNNSGETIHAPYDFIKRLVIANLSVTEPSGASVVVEPEGVRSRQPGEGIATS